MRELVGFCHRRRLPDSGDTGPVSSSSFAGKWGYGSCPRQVGIKGPVPGAE